MVVAKAFLSRRASYVAIASRRTLNSAHPSGFRTSHPCSLLSSRMGYEEASFSLWISGCVRAQLALKTLASWMPAVVVYKYGYSTSVLKHGFCYENMHFVLPRAWGNAKLIGSKSSYISSRSLYLDVTCHCKWRHTCSICVCRTPVCLIPLELYIPLQI